MVPEKVRLVIWDLDDTFWSGTITEGGHVYNQDHHEIVLALARRGIISSICSKNDLKQVRDILTETGLWDYFVFPSINWEPKGQRVARLIEDMQLRPQTVLFIDDNHLNRSEALYFVPGLQVADEQCIADLLQSDFLKGKDDHDLSRLKQYKMLESRKGEEKAAGGDNMSFMRQSGINVTIDYDVEANIDRAVELVNRTNQLNFTKQRLPEDAFAARAQLRDEINKHDVQAGLIHVKDRYGDYGYCGFFALRVGAVSSRFVHFCFSCRILNMGVESYVFNVLGRPDLNVVGDVLTDIVAESAAMPDWINMHTDASHNVAEQGTRIDQVIAFGTCNISSLARYFLVTGAEIVTEVNIVRHGISIIRNHSHFLRFAAQGVTEDEQEALQAIGYEPEDWTTALLKPQRPDPVWLLSFWADPGVTLFRHKRLGFAIPMTLPCLPPGCRDTSQADIAHVPEGLRNEWARGVVHRMQNDYVWAGPANKISTAANIHLLMKRAPQDAKVFVLLNIEFAADDDGNRVNAPFKAVANQTLREAFARYPNVVLIDPVDFVRNEHEWDKNPSHLGREVFYRIYKHITERVDSWRHKAAEPVNG